MALGRHTGIWKTLDVAPTRDRNTIRRAYARQLKVTNPEDDAEGFKVLRAAYEQALAQSGRAEHAQVSDPERLPVFIDPPVQEFVEDRVEAGDDSPPSPTSFPASPPADPSAMDLWYRDLARLETLLQQPNGDPAVIVTIFDAIVTSPEMAAISAHAVAERRLAHVISVNAPRSDVLLGRVIARFRWDRDARRDRIDFTIGQVLARNADLPFLREVRHKKDPDCSAFQVLSAPPQPLTWLSRLTGPSPESIVKLLDIIRQRHPSVLQDLNPAIVQGWDTYFSQPRLPSWGVIGCNLTLLSLVVAPFIWFLVPHVQWYLFLAFLPPVIVATAALCSLYGYAWPRYLWRDRLDLGSAWRRWGWLGTGLCALVLTAVPPLPFPLLGWGLVSLIVVLSIVTTLWAGVSGKPDRRDSDTPWQIRMLQGHLFLPVWWLISAWKVPLQTQLAMTAALTGGIAATGLTKMTVRHAWLAAPKWSRLSLLAVLFCLGLPSGCLLFASQDEPGLLTPAICAIAAIVLVYRAPLLDDTRFNIMWRSTGIGLFGLFYVMVTLTLPTPYFVGMVLLVWYMFAMIGTFNAVRKA